MQLWNATSQYFTQLELLMIFDNLYFFTIFVPFTFNTNGFDRAVPIAQLSAVLFTSSGTRLSSKSHVLFTAFSEQEPRGQEITVDTRKSSHTELDETESQSL